MDGPSCAVSLACVQSHMAQASKGLGKHPAEFKPYYETLLPECLRKHCREWPAGKINAEIQLFIEANSKKPQDIVIHTDCSVTRGRSA